MAAWFDFENDDAPKEWLTSVLTSNGYLELGEVTQVSRSSTSVGQAAGATFYRLDIEYSDASLGSKPIQMLLKVGKPGATEGFESTLEMYAAYQMIPQALRYDLIQKEPAFYEMVRSEGFPLPLIKCYGTAVDYEGHQHCLLLDDMSNDYSEPMFPLPPSKRACANTVKSLAQVHAHWWNSDRFGEEDYTVPSKATVDEAVAIYATAYKEFENNIGDRLSQPRREIYSRALDTLPGLLERRFGQSNLTLIHGDAHHWNVLVHKQTEACIIYDWQTWHVDCAAHDLSYLMGLSWFAERRQRLERPMLDCYLEELARLGVDYSGQLEFDYRLSLVRQLFSPILLSRLLHPAVWWPHIDRIFSSFEDWDCAELF